MSAECGKGWAKRCANSKGKKCRCSCGGENHGNPAARKDNAQEESLPMTPQSTLYYNDGWGPQDGERRIPTQDELLQPDDRVLRFVRTTVPGPFGDVETAHVYLVEADGEAQLPRRYVSHSPTGFEWGYGGSGPADTALNILALVIPVKEATCRGLQHYQNFKEQFVARVPRDGGEIKLADVRRWLAAAYATPETDQ